MASRLSFVQHNLYDLTKFRSREEGTITGNSHERTGFHAQEVEASCPLTLVSKTQLLKHKGSGREMVFLGSHWRLNRRPI